MITIEKICEVFGIASKWRNPKRTEEGYSIYTTKGDLVCKAPLYPGSYNWHINHKLIVNTPEILHGLINMVDHYGDLAYEGDSNMWDKADTDIVGQAIKYIESCDYKNRKWFELRKELLRR